MSPDRGLVAHLVVHRGEAFVLEISLTIPPGRTVALLGPNAAGKSTAVAALAGLVPLDAGCIELDGAVLDDPGIGHFTPPDARRIGVVFQDYVLFPHLTVEQNVAFGLRSRGVPRSAALERAASWLRRLDLDGLADRRPGDLSGGQAQRVAVARALVTEPDLLLLDEPLSALDVTTRVELRRTLAERLGQFDGPRLVITHDPSEAFLLADEIAVIEDGTVTQVGTADDIRLRPRTRYVADLAGSNLLVGTASNGILSAGAHPLRIADKDVNGPVVASIQPRAIALRRSQPEGLPNTWSTTAALIEDLGERVRVELADPLPLTAEMEAHDLRALGLTSGSAVWVSVEPTDIAVEPS